MMRKKKSLLATLLLFLVLMIPCCSVFTASAATNATDPAKASYTSVTSKRTKLFKTIDKKNVLLTIPKGATVTVLKTWTKKKNVYKVKYKGKVGFINAANILDSAHPADYVGDMSAYDYEIQKAPGFYARAKYNTSVLLQPNNYSDVVGTIYKNAIVGIYGSNSNGYYVVSYNGERNYVSKSAFVKTTPIGSNMYVAAINGGRLRQSPVILTTNVTDSLPYKTRVTLLSSTRGSDGFIWYRVLVIAEDKYYVEGYMREDVLTTQKPNSGTMPIEGGSNRVVNTGTSKNAILRDGPNGKEIGSIQNKSVVYATGRTSYAGGRDWAEITSPKKGWIAASFIF